MKETKKEEEATAQKALTLVELKAMAFDYLVEIERLKAIYTNVQNEIARLINNDTTV